jgi:hypothetical protein
MNFRDPRWAKTFQIVMLAVFSFWMGHLDAEAPHGTRYWVMMLVYTVGLVGSLFLLLRDVWKRNA